MQITCPRCFAAYNVPEAMFAAGPRKVRCSSCHFEWQESPVPQETVAAFAPPSDIPVPDSPVFPPAAPEAEAPKPKAPRRGRVPAEKSKGLSTAAAWCFFLLATGICALVLLRENIGHKAIWLTDMYEAVGLPVEGPNDWFKFEGVSLERNEQDGQINLTVRGQVINTSRKAREVPPLRLYWLPKTGERGPETVLQARPGRIGIDDAARFSGELRGIEAALGGEVKVTFVTGQQAAAPAAAEHAKAPAPAAQGKAKNSDHASPAQDGHAPAPQPDAHNSGH